MAQETLITTDAVYSAEKPVSKSSRFIDILQRPALPRPLKPVRSQAAAPEYRRGDTNPTSYQASANIKASNSGPKTPSGVKLSKTSKKSKKSSHTGGLVIPRDHPQAWVFMREEEQTQKRWDG